jgi:hypothetical protein
MKKMKFLFAVLAIVFAAGSAFTPAKKAKPVTEKYWFQYIGDELTGNPASSAEYVLTNLNDEENEGESIECPTTHSARVCGVYAKRVLDMGSVYRPDDLDLSDIVSDSESFTEAATNLQYVDIEE